MTVRNTVTILGVLEKFRPSSGVDNNDNTMQWPWKKLIATKMASVEHKIPSIKLIPGTAMRHRVEDVTLPNDGMPA